MFIQSLTALHLTRPQDRIDSNSFLTQRESYWSKRCRELRRAGISRTVAHDCERGGEGTIAEYRPLYSYDDDDDDDGSRRMRMSMRADSPHLSSPSLTLQRLESPLLPSNLIDPFTAVDVLIVLTYLHCVVLQLLTA